jgi:hypothetical protein
MIKSVSLVAVAVLSWGALLGCTEAPKSGAELAASEEVAADAEIASIEELAADADGGASAVLGSNREALCSNGDGVNSVMAALAVATAKELGRWQPATDFTQNSSPWSLVLTSTGKARCADGKCWNTQAILDLQKAKPNSVKFGNVVFNANNLVSTLVARWNEQVNCEKRGGTGDQNCSAEQHKLTFQSSKPGACDTLFTFGVTNTSGGALKAPGQLKNKLMYVGYPSNPYLAFSSTGTTVTLDPTYGLTEGTATTSGSCTAACTKLTTSSIVGSCCSCNGATGKYVRAAWNTSTYLCQ